MIELHSTPFWNANGAPLPGYIQAAFRHLVEALFEGEE